MAARALELKSGKTTAEIEAEAGEMLGLVDIKLPLTLAGWDIVALADENSGLPVVVRSADGDVFIGEISEVDEDRYTVTVELI